MKARHETLMGDPEYRRLYAIEGVVTDAAELVARLMEEKRVNKAELARRLGKSRAWVTQLLSGKANMTIRTLAEVAYALHAEVKLSTQRGAVRQDRSSLDEFWMDEFKFNPPSAGHLWKIQEEFQLAHTDLPPLVRAGQAYDAEPGRLEYAA